MGILTWVIIGYVGYKIIKGKKVEAGPDTEQPVEAPGDPFGFLKPLGPGGTATPVAPSWTMGDVYFPAEVIGETPPDGGLPGIDDIIEGKEDFRPQGVQSLITKNELDQAKADWKAGKITLSQFQAILHKSYYPS